MSNFITKLDSILPHGWVNDGFFLEQTYYREFFSHGMLHMAEVAIDGLPMFTRGRITGNKTTDFFDLLSAEIETNPVRKFFFFTTTACQVGKIRFIKYHDDSGIHKDYRFKFIDSEHDHFINSIGKGDLSFLSWFLRYYKHNSNEHPIMQKMIAMAIEKCETNMEEIIINFHDIVNNTNKYSHSAEVAARQLTMGFYGLFTLRNILHHNGDLDKPRVIPFDPGLSQPINLFEAICNSYNETDYHTVADIYNETFHKREMEGKVSIAKAIILGGGHQGIINRITNTR